MTVTLPSLPDPIFLETLSYEETLAELVDATQAIFDAASIAYNVGALETDPVKIVLEAVAARDVRNRARVNDAAKANLVTYASGSDLDQLAAFYDVTRLALETDGALRLRVIEAIQGRSPGGSEFWYSAAARRSDVRIKDVKVYREANAPIIHVAVLSSVNGGVPDAPMLAAVEAEVTSVEVRLINDVEIIVEAATSQTVNVVAQVWTLPSTPPSLVTGLAQVLRDAWAIEGGIGFDLDTSWIAARLHVAGIKKVVVQAPASSVVASAFEAIAIGTVTITNMGTSY